MRLITTLLLLLFLCFGCKKSIDYRIDEQGSASELAKPEFVPVGETSFPCLNSYFKVNGLFSPSSSGIGSQPTIQLELFSNQLTKPTLPKSVQWNVSANNYNSVFYSPTISLLSSSGKQHFVSLTLGFENNVTSKIDFCLSTNNSRLEICTNNDIVGGGLSCEGGKPENTTATIDQRAGGIDIFIY